MRFQGKKVKIENRNYANKNTHQQICHATFLENRFNLAVLEMICVIFTNLVKYSANKKPPNQKCWHNISLDPSLTHPENRPHCLFIPETENKWLSWFAPEGLEMRPAEKSWRNSLRCLLKISWAWKVWGLIIILANKLLRKIFFWYYLNITKVNTCYPY